MLSYLKTIQNILMTLLDGSQVRNRCPLGYLFVISVDVCVCVFFFFLPTFLTLLLGKQHQFMPYHTYKVFLNKVGNST